MRLDALNNTSEPEFTDYRSMSVFSVLKCVFSVLKYEMYIDTCRTVRRPKVDSLLELPH